MKRILFTLVVIVLFSGALFAVENSQTFGPLVTSPVFRMRVSYNAAFTAPVILTEASTGSYTAACHTLRANLAARVASNPESYSSVFAAHLVTMSAVTSAGTLTGTSAAGTLDSPITDAAMFSAISSAWSTVAGCITNP